MTIRKSLVSLLAAFSLASFLSTAKAEDKDKFNPGKDVEKAIAGRVVDGGKAVLKLDFYTGLNCLKDAVYNTMLLPVRGVFALNGIEGEPIYDPNNTGSFPVTHYSTDYGSFRPGIKKSDVLLHFLTIPYDAKIGPEQHSAPVFEQADNSFKKGDVVGGVLKSACGVVSVPIEHFKAMDWFATKYVRMLIEPEEKMKKLMEEDTPRIK